MDKLFFDHFDLWILFRWIYWLAIFFLSLGPAYKTLGASKQTASNKEEVFFFKYTISITGFTTVIGFLGFAFWG